MAGIEVGRAQRQGARGLLAETLAVAHSGEWSPKRDGYRDWLTTPSETLCVVLGQASEDHERWLKHGHVAGGQSPTCSAENPVAGMWSQPFLTRHQRLVLLAPKPAILRL